MKKVLFVIQSFPAIRSANVLCDTAIIQEWKKNTDIEIHCLVYRYNNLPDFEELDGVKIHRFKRGLIWKLYCWAKENKGIISKSILRINRFVLRLKQLFTIPIYPCYEPVLALKYRKEAIKLHKMECFDMVIAEHNGFDTMYAGFMLKRYDPNVLYVQIFWDSLSGGFGAKYLPQSYTDKKRINWEKKILTYADKSIIMASHESHADKLWKDYDFFNKISYLDIPYYIRVERQNNDKEKGNSMISIVFAGSMGMRDPQFACRLFSDFGNKDIVLHIYTSDIYHEKIRKVLEYDNSSIVLHDYVSHDELLEIYSNADVFFNIGVKNSNAISGKIFEYMSYGKPIISTYSIDDEACLPYLQKYPLALCVDERNGNLDALRKRVYDFIMKNYRKRIDSSIIESLLYKNMPKSYVDLLNKLLFEKENKEE